MPQLSIETFVTQYFWLVVTLMVFYFLAVTQILPKIGNILKTRQEIESASTGAGSTDSALDVSEQKARFVEEFSNNYKTIGANLDSIGSVTNYDLTTTDWMDKQ